MHLSGGGCERLPGPVDLLDDLGGRLRPDERPGVLVVGLDVLLQARFEVGDGVEGLKWSYFVGQSEGKAKVDSDWF